MWIFPDEPLLEMMLTWNETFFYSEWNYMLKNFFKFEVIFYRVNNDVYLFKFEFEFNWIYEVISIL